MENKQHNFIHSHGIFGGNIFCSKCGYIVQKDGEGGILTHDGKERMSEWRVNNVPKQCI